jgi:hypothetical protein
MELCDPRLIQILMTTPARLRMSPTAESPPTKQAKPSGWASRCRCGQCPTCEHNARWERIFREKFADPEYYAPRPVRYTSSLNFVI